MLKSKTGPPSRLLPKNMLSLSVLYLTISLIRAEQMCQTFPNYKTKNFTYLACNGTDVTNLETSRAFCKEHFLGSDVVTFPNYEEYSFLVASLNDTMEKDFKYVPGVYQEKDNSNRYNPETGKFFWTSDPETRITNESQTYWWPLRQLIVDFDELSLFYQQYRTFLLDLDGKMYYGVSLGGGKSETPLDGGVICMKKGVPMIAPDGSGISTPLPQVASFQYWIVISVAVAVIILGILFASVAYCVFKKTKRQKQTVQKFHAVPQTDNQVPKQYSV